MENHTFSEPIPLPESYIQPCWKVEVFRNGVDEAVGCLEVNPMSLPPRKANKKNKILWKLPENLEDKPRFGGHEKERLWELFKLQKKQRRRSKKKMDDDEDDTKNGGESMEINIASLALESKGADASVSKPVSPPATQQPPSATTTPPPPPPPGFGTGGHSLEEKKPNTQPKPAPQNGGDATNPAPPAPVSTPRGGNGSHPHISPPPQPIPQSTLQETPTTPLPLSFVFGSMSAIEIASLPPPLLKDVIGSHLAKSLIHSLTSPGQLSFWLAHYHPLAQKLLLFGSAQAVAVTAADRQQQWESLILSQATTAQTGPNGEVIPPIAAWDCQGWTVQNMLEQNSSSIVSDAVEPPSLLAVLSGRTIQQQEILTYHLTLVLRPLPPVPPPPSMDPSLAQKQPVRYQIHNEILSLSRAAVP